MAKKVKEDLIKWELDINASPAQKSLHATAVETKNLEKQNKELEKQMKALTKAGKEGSDEWNALSKTLSENTTAIDKNKKKMDGLYQSMENSEKTTSQLRTEAQKLRRELDNMTRGTDAYKAKSEQLTAVQNELKDAQGQNNEAMNGGGALMTAVSAKAAVLTGVFVGMGLKLISLAGDYFSLNKIMNSNQTTGDKLAAEMAGLNRVFETLQVRIANLDFKGLVQDMFDAYTTGKEVAIIMDELFERENSLKIMTAQQAAQVVSLQENMKNVNLSYEERRNAAAEIIRITNEQAEIEKKIAEDKAESAKTELKNRTKMNDDEVKFIVDQYNQNRDVISQSMELLQLEEDLAATKKINRKLAAEGIPTDFSDEDRIKARIKIFKEEHAEMAKVAEMVKKYNLGNDELVNNYVESVVKAVQVESNAKQSLMRVTTSMHTLDKQISEEQRKAGDEASKKAKEKLEADIKQAELDKKTADEQLKAKKDLLGKIESLQNAFDESQMSAEDQRLLQLARKYQDVQKELDAAFENKLLSEQEYNDKSKELQVLHAQEELALIEANRAKITEAVNEEAKRMDADAYRIKQELLADNLEATRDMELAALQELHEAKKLSDEEYARASMNVQLKYMQNRLQKERQLLSNASNIAGSLQDLALSKVETRYQQELAAAGDNAEKKAAVEEQYEKDKLEVQKQYADINFAIKASSIIADTAAAIMQGYAQLGPIGGSVTAAMLTAVGAVQLAMANQERKRVKSMQWSGSGSGASADASTAVTGNVVLKDGFFEGGPTGAHLGVNEVAGVVHGQEYVIPAWQMKMPETVEIVKMLESVRRSKGPGTGASRSSSSVAGYEGGGEVASSGGGMVVPVSEFRALIAALNALTAEPLKAYVLLSELEKAQKRQEISRKKGAKS